MNYWSNRVLIDPQTGNRVIFGSRDVTKIITIPENPYDNDGLIDLNYCNYGYCDDRFLDDYLDGALDVPCYKGSGRCFSPYEFGLNYFFKYTRAFIHKDAYFKNSIDLKRKHICVIWNLGQSKKVTLALENYDLIVRRNAGMQFTKFNTVVWDKESLMNKKYVYDINGKTWRDICELYGINI